MNPGHARIARWWLGLALCLGLLLPEATRAQTVAARGTQWQVLPVQTRDVAVTPAGDVHALDADGAPWRLPAAAAAQGAANAWMLQPGRFARLRATLDGALWALDVAGVLHREQGSVWRPVAEGVHDVAAAPDGSTWWLLADGRVLNPANQETLPLPEGRGTPVRLAVDEHGQPWLLLDDGRAWRREGAVWRDMAPAALDLRELAIASDGTVMAVDAAGTLLQRVARGGAWVAHPVPEPLQRQVARLALGAGGLPWLVTRGGALVVERPLDTAAVPVPRTPALFTRLLAWRPVGGQAVGVALGADGSAFSVAPDGAVWQWQGDNRWKPLGGHFSAVAAGTRGLAWGLAAGADGRGRVHVLDGGFWRALPGVATRIAAGPHSTLWAVMADDTLQRWNATQRQWERVGALPPEVRALAIGASGAPWIVAADGSVQTAAAGSAGPWQAVPGLRATSLAIGPDDTVYATTADAELRWLDRREMQWKPASGTAVAVAVGPDGAPWIVTPGQALLASDRFLRDEAQRAESARAAAAAPAKPVLTVTPAVVPSTLRPLAFEPIFSADVGFSDIGIGANGAVFAVGSQGGLFCFSNASRRFLLASSGQARRVAVAPDGQPWLLNRSGVVQRFDKGAWQAVPDFLGQDIAVGPDGQAWAVDRAGDVHRYAAATTQRFTRVETLGADAPYRAARVAGANAGVHWLVTDDQRLLRCEKGQCATRLTGAQDVAVAPDNTVFALDLLGKLRRANATGTAFEPTAGASPPGGASLALAVGPQGLPWVVSADGKVSAAGLFNPLSRTVNTDACVLPFAQSPVPVEPPPLALRLSDVVITLPPGGTLDLLLALVAGTANARPLSLDEMTLALNEAPPLLSLRGGTLQLAASAPVGTRLDASVTACPKRGGSVCATARLAVTALAAPVAPRDVVAVAGNGQAQVSFSTQDGGGSGTVYTVTASPGGATARGAASPVVVNGLQNGLEVRFSVVATNAAGSSPPSAPSAPVVPAGVPGAPLQLQATLTGPATAQLDFVAAPPNGSPVTGYTLTAVPPGPTLADPAAVAPPLRLQGLAAGVAYGFTLTARNALGSGPASAVSNTVGSDVPGAPTAVMALAGDAQATVSFSAPASSGTSAILRYEVTASPGGASASGTASPIVVSGLANGTAYRFTVRAVSAVGNGPSSMASPPVTPATVPSAPGNVVATRGNAMASVAFTSPASNGGSTVTGYTVTASPGGATASGVVSPIDVSGLTNGTAYTFSVRARNAVGDGPASAPSTPVVPATVPLAPTGIVEELATITEVGVSFTPPASDGGSPITGYRVLPSPVDPALVIFQSGPSTFRVQGLTFTTAYTFRVVATNALGDSAPSAPSSVVNPSTRPLFPGAISGTPGPAQITVNLLTPASDGGSPITSYTVVLFPAVPNGEPERRLSSPFNSVRFTGLTPGVQYAFYGWASNANGRGATSPANTATPF